MYCDFIQNIIKLQINVNAYLNVKCNISLEYESQTVIILR